jgi:tRNA_anti-like
MRTSRKLPGSNKARRTTMTGKISRASLIILASLFALSICASAQQQGNTGVAPIPYTTLSRAYLDNEVGAQAKYDGKRVTVSGRVHSVRNDKGKIEVHFIDPVSVSLPVNCYFPASQAAVLGKLKYGDEIIVVGTVHGSRYSGVVLEDCVLRWLGRP